MCDTYPRVKLFVSLFPRESLTSLRDGPSPHSMRTMRIYHWQKVQNASAPWDISLKTPSLGWSIFHRPMMGFRHATQRLAIFCHCWGTEVWQTRIHPKQFYQKLILLMMQDWLREHWSNAINIYLLHMYMYITLTKFILGKRGWVGRGFDI